MLDRPPGSTLSGIHFHTFCSKAGGRSHLPFIFLGLVAIRTHPEVISNQARFPREQITFAGEATAWKRTAESGNALTFHFCPTCGSTVYWEGEGFPGYVAVAIGAFADPEFPPPTIAVWEESRHPWVSLPPDTPPKRVAKQA